MTAPTDLIRDPRVYRLAAVGQAADAAACIGPIPYITRCLDTVEYPQTNRWIFPVVKGASAIGLASVTRSPTLARLTAIMLTVYFTLAVSAHVRVRDFGLNAAAATSFLLFYGALAATGPADVGDTP
ncbi:DoxX family protein [Gordonia spumicola]|nr:DoxX family protein [Gordonia spumicola]